MRLERLYLIKCLFLQESFISGELSFDERPVRLRALHRILETWALLKNNVMAPSMDLFQTVIKKLFNYFNQLVNGKIEGTNAAVKMKTRK